MMHYSEPLYRPPSEANSLIFQVTEGCSFNRCSFCSMYRSKQYREKPLDQVIAEISHMASLYPETRRVFLADGDALARSESDLLIILENLYQSFPQLQRVSSYALPANLIRKSDAELQCIRENGLQLIYYGIETGDAALLKRITKGATPESMVEGLNKASGAGLKISATVILGLGGEQFWEEHIDGTAALVNKCSLNYLSTLQLYLEPVVEREFFEKFERKGDRFVVQDDHAILHEQARLIAAVDPQKPLIFRSNHASNALPLKGVLPKDRERLLAQLGAAEKDETMLRPGWMRGL